MPPLPQQNPWEDHTKVKYVEAAGGRVVPILYDWDDEQLAEAREPSLKLVDFPRILRTHA